MAGWEGKTLDQARADAHEQLRTTAAEVHADAREVRQLNERSIAAEKEAKDAQMALYRKTERLHAIRTNAVYLDGLPDDAAPGDPPSSVDPDKQARILARIDRDVRPVPSPADLVPTPADIDNLVARGEESIR